MGSDVLHHDEQMAEKPSPHDHTQGASDRELEQAGCRAIMGMGDTIQLLCRDQDVGLHSIGNAALCLRSWCDSMQQYRADKEKAEADRLHERQMQAEKDRIASQGGGTFAERILAQRISGQDEPDA